MMTGNTLPPSAALARDELAVERRRRHVLFDDWRWAFVGRRRGSASVDDEPENGVDRYHPTLLVLTLAIFLFSALDAILTLRLLDHGIAVEANPLMRLLIERDVQEFANVKTAMTAGALVFMVACSSARFFRRVRVRRLMYLVLVGYAALVTYELVMLRFLAG